MWDAYTEIHERLGHDLFVVWLTTGWYWEWGRIWQQIGPSHHLPETVLLNIYAAQESIRSAYIAKLTYSLAGWHDNPVPTWFLAPIDCSKIPAQPPSSLHLLRGRRNEQDRFSHAWLKPVSNSLRGGDLLCCSFKLCLCCGEGWINIRTNRNIFTFFCSIDTIVCINGKGGRSASKFRKLQIRKLAGLPNWLDLPTFRKCGNCGLAIC